LAELEFDGVSPAATGRPSYHPSVLLKLYIYGYLNRVQSSRRLEREAGRNVEVMWLLGRLIPDHKTIADFRKDNFSALRKVCARFVEWLVGLAKFIVSIGRHGSSFLRFRHSLELCWKTENPTNVCGSITSDGCKVGSRQKCIAIAVRVCSKLHTTWPHTLRLRAAILLALLRRDP
jgi:Transposase domain (DUF772)